MINNNDNWKIYVLTIIFEKIIFYFQENLI